MKNILKIFLLVFFIGGLSSSEFQFAQIQQKLQPVKQKPRQLVKSIKVLYPKGGEVWEGGKIYAIRWQSVGISGNVKIFLKREDTGSVYSATEASGVPNNGTFEYAVRSSLSGGKYKVQVTTLDGTVVGESDQYVNIGKPTIRPLQPLQLAPLLVYMGKSNNLIPFNSGEGKVVIIPRDVNWYQKTDSYHYTVSVDFQFNVMNPNSIPISLDVGVSRGDNLITKQTVTINANTTQTIKLQNATLYVRSSLGAHYVENLVIQGKELISNNFFEFKLFPSFVLE